MSSAPPKKVHRKHQVAVALATSLASLASLTSLTWLAGCADPVPPDPASVSSGVNAAANDSDLHFAEIMPGHHDQAIEMSAMLLDKPGLSPTLTELAQRIQATHQSQYDAMTTWAGTWATDATASHIEDPDQDGVGHHGGQGGLMTEDQMKDLDLADTPSAQKLYLDGMIRHHQGALNIAEDEIKNGKNAEAVAGARSIADTHPAVITAMTDARTRL
ncbi:MAG TPA: DUF305 domain-containing protein [Propionibacteriaceae bacterium]